MNLKFYTKATERLASLRKFVALSLLVLASVGSSYAQQAGALSFDGTNDFVTVPVKPALNISTAITIEAWINPTYNSFGTVRNVQDVMSKSNSGSNNGYIFPRTSQAWNSIEILVNLNTGGWQQLRVPYGQDKLDQWHHVAATYDGTKLIVYVDGVSAGEMTFSGSITVNNNPLTIGNQPGFSEYYTGSLDEARIYNRALTACEIQNSMNCELGSTPTQQNGLAAYYKFNQGLLGLPNPLINTVTDSSPTHADGTMNNFGLLDALLSNWVAGSAVNGTCSEFVPSSVTVGAARTIVPQGGTINLTATGSGTGGTYSWVGANGFTSSQQNPSISGVGLEYSGVYTCTYTDPGGCSVVGSVTITVGLLASGLNLDGTDDFVAVPNSPSLNPGKALSVEAWIYPTGGSTIIQNVVSKSSRTDNTGYKFPKTNDQWATFSFEISINGQWKTLTGSFPSAALNKWNHVAATYDGFYMRIYQNGVLAGTLEAAGSIDANTNDLLIGNQDGRVEYFKGNVDEVRIWSRALSQCEIINNMQTCELNGANNGLANQVGLAAYYRFNQGLINVNNAEYNVLADSSGHGNNGILTNMSLNGVTSNWNEGKVYGLCDYFPLPTLNVTANGSIFQTGTTVKLFANNGNGTNIWDGPNSFTSNVQNPVITNAQPVATGIYTVTNPYVNCVVTASARITVSDAVQIVANGPTTFCPSGSVVLSTSNSGPGSGPAPGSTYQWFRNDVLIPGATANQYTATATGNYSINITTGTDVAVSSSIAVTVLVDNTAPVPHSPSLQTLNVTAPYTVNNIPTADDNCRGSVNGTPNRSLTFAQNGTFTITWTYDDLNGNTSTQTQTVIVTGAADVTPPVLTVPSNINANATVANCGAIVNFAATATDDSNSPVTIAYSKNPGTLFPVGTTVVTVTATDASNNVSTGSFSVTVAPTPVAAITGTTNVCVGATTTLSDITTGGTWSSSNTAVATVNASGVVTGVTAGTANIIYTNACGVSATVSVTVKPVPAAPTVSVTDNCGTSTLTASNTTGSILWSTGATTASISVPTAGTYTVAQTVNGCTSSNGSGVAAPKAAPSAPTTAVANNCGTSTLTASNTTGSILWSTGATTASISVSAAGSYTVTQTVNGCTSSAATAVAAPKAIPAAPSVSVADNCGTSTLTASNTTGSILWSTGATTASISVSAAGTYTVTQTVNGCTSTIGSGVAAPKATPSTPATAVANNCGTSTLTASNTTGSILWSTGATTASISVSTAGTYTVTQTVNGCTSSAATAVAAPKATQSTPVVTAVFNCGSTTLNTNATGSLVWSNGATTSSTTVTTAGTYTVTATNTAGCSATSNATSFAVNTNPVVSGITGTTTVTVGSTTQLSDATSGGVWSSNSTNATVNTTGLVTGVTAGTATISYTVTNSNGCSTVVTATVTVSQPTCLAPVFGTMNNISVSSSAGKCTAPVAYTVNITAIPAATLTYTFSGATTGSGAGSGSGATFNGGTTTVVIKAVNGCGTATKSFTITVLDTQAPVPNVTTLPTITGVCSAGLAVSQPPSNSNNCDDDCRCCRNGCHCRGNDCGCRSNDYRSRVYNIISYLLDYYFNNDDDDHGCDHDDNNNNNNNNNNGGSTVAAPTATDNCKGTITGTTTDPLNYSSQGTYTIHWKYDDGNGNVTIQNQTVIVKDNIAPVPNASNLPTINGTCSVNVTNVPTAKDNCAGNITGTTTDPLSYSGSGTYVIHWSFNDGNGNVTTQNQTVVLTDNVKPTLTEPNDITVSCGTSISPSVTGNARATDNCSGVVITYSDVTNGNRITRTWKATDESGNYSTDTQIITVADNTKPVLTEPNDVTVSCGGSTAPSATGTATATDNCGSVNITYSDVTSNNKITRTWRATDGSGNYSTDVQVITLGNPFNASIASVPNSSTYTGGVSTNLYLGYGAQSTNLQVCSLPSSGAPYSYSWSGNSINRLNSTSSSAPVFTPSTYGYYTFNVTVTNKFGCTSTESISICVTDIRVPGTNGSKVYLCHKTSGRYGSTQTIQVAINSVASHLGGNGNGHSSCGNNDDDDRLGSCDQTPCNQVVSNSTTPVVSNSTGMTKETGSTVSTVATEEDLKVTVMPNPSPTVFTLKFESKFETPVNLRVMDASGRVVDAKTKLGSNSTIQVGASYMVGTYFAEITQGNIRKVVQLIKVK